MNSLNFTASELSQISDLPFAQTIEEQKAVLLDLENGFYLVQDQGRLLFSPEAAEKNLAFIPPLPLSALGDPDFRRVYGTSAALYAGAMANGISSVEMLIALGKAGLMGSFGAGGLSLARIGEAIKQVQAALPQGPYLFNLINSPFEALIEEKTAELYLRLGVRAIEASAYLTLTLPLVWYRAAGLQRTPEGGVAIGNRIIAKVSRQEVARKFLSPAPSDLLKKLLEQGRITDEQARMAAEVPMADDITVEADSGGHTDRRPLLGVLPQILAQRDEYQKKYTYKTPVRIGAGGGIATPAAALAAFMLGAAYVVTGSLNQACIESGASGHTRQLLAKADLTDMTMAPAGDMFEMGVQVQVLKRGSMFAMRAQKLYELYRLYDSWQAIPLKEKENVEGRILQRCFEDVWQDCQRFFGERDPSQIERAERDPKAKMALVFRWYLGLSSRWSNEGVKGREMDYQIWCGPAMGAFNDWVRGSSLEDPAERRAAEVNRQILLGAAYLYRLRMLPAYGVNLAQELANYRPVTI